VISELVSRRYKFLLTTKLREVGDLFPGRYLHKNRNLPDRCINRYISSEKRRYTTS